jgi:hypothetical protein
MSEFKFACPFCGQHITADAGASGKQLECPTCFQRIVAPQAPVGGDPKLILSASKVSSTRSKLFETDSDLTVGRAGSRSLKASLTPILLLVGIGGLAFLLWRNELTSLANGLAERATSPVPIEKAVNAFQSPHPIPTGVSWSLNLTNAPMPNSQVVGSIHGQGFLCERATLKAGRLSLRQGLASSPDLGITVSLGVRLPEDLSGKMVIVTPNAPLPAPRVVLRWRDDQQEPVTEHVHAGYAMKLVFGPIANDRIRGRIFIALPDEQKSFAAGTFEAELAKPAQPLAGK